MLDADMALAHQHKLSTRTSNGLTNRALGASLIAAIPLSGNAAFHYRAIAVQTKSRNEAKR
jgi:hypothetical protein